MWENKNYEIEEESSPILNQQGQTSEKDSSPNTLSHNPSSMNEDQDQQPERLENPKRRPFNSKEKKPTLTNSKEKEPVYISKSKKFSYLWKSLLAYSVQSALVFCFGVNCYLFDDFYHLVYEFSSSWILYLVAFALLLSVVIISVTFKMKLVFCLKPLKGLVPWIIFTICLGFLLGVPAHHAFGIYVTPICSMVLGPLAISFVVGCLRTYNQFIGTIICLMALVSITAIVFAIFEEVSGLFICLGVLIGILWAWCFPAYISIWTVEDVALVENNVFFIGSIKMHYWIISGWNILGEIYSLFQRRLRRDKKKNKKDSSGSSGNE